jgi:tetratricopeptide (TPR) repeat protein
MAECRATVPAAIVQSCSLLPGVLQHFVVGRTPFGGTIADVMRGTRRHGHPWVLVALAFPLRARALICITAALWAAPLAAQASRAQIGDHGFGYDFHNIVPSVPDDRVKVADSAPSTTTVGDESCFMPPLTGVRSPTTGVASLKVPGGARKDFQHACTAANHKNLAKAEGHLREALHQDTQYPAAWVLLGQVLKAQQKPDDARNACSEALSVDPNYLPADLCIADLSAVEQRWEEMLRFANSAVALDPANDPHAYFYVAGAYFALHRVAAAESSALKAAEIDKARREPRTHFLLAQIYELERKPDAEAAQLQEYLKSVTDPQEVAMVKKYLADLAGNRR